MKKLIKIFVLTAVLAVVLAVPCFAEDVTADNTVGVSGAVASAVDWLLANPETALAAVVTGVAGGVNLAGGVSNRKTRRNVTLKADSLQNQATAINNNAVELAGTVKAEIVNMIQRVTEELGIAVKAICNKVDELINTVHENVTETKALRREVKAVSFQIGELVKDSRMTQLRKDEIAKGTEDILRGGEEVNDDSDQA